MPSNRANPCKTANSPVVHHSYGTRRSTQTARPAHAAGLAKRTKEEISHTAAQRAAEKARKQVEKAEKVKRVEQNTRKLAQLEDTYVSQQDQEDRELRTAPPLHKSSKGLLERQVPSPAVRCASLDASHAGADHAFTRLSDRPARSQRAAVWTIGPICILRYRLSMLITQVRNQIRLGLATLSSQAVLA